MLSSLTLKGSVLMPLNGKLSDSVVLMFHGYGSSGDDLIGIGRAWQKFLPKTVFLAPNGIDPWEGGGLGHQWFSIKNHNTKNFKFTAMSKIIPIIKKYINEILCVYEILPSRLVLMGFSQGSMLALRVGLEKDINLAGIIVYSGAFIREENFRPNIHVPVALFHGKKDESIPYSMFLETQKKLESLNVSVTSKIYPLLGHGISEESIKDGLLFLNQILNV